jgi:hypothetical protein
MCNFVGENQMSEAVEDGRIMLASGERRREATACRFPGLRSLRSLHPRLTLSGRLRRPRELHIA